MDEGAEDIHPVNIGEGVAIVLKVGIDVDHQDEDNEEQAQHAIFPVAGPFFPSDFPHKLSFL